MCRTHESRPSLRSHFVCSRRDKVVTFARRSSDLSRAGMIPLRHHRTSLSVVLAAYSFEARLTPTPCELCRQLSRAMPIWQPSKSNVRLSTLRRTLNFLLSVRCRLCRGRALKGRELGEYFLDILDGMKPVVSAFVDDKRGQFVSYIVDVNKRLER